MCLNRDLWAQLHTVGRAVQVLELRGRPGFPPWDPIYLLLEGRPPSHFFCRPDCADCSILWRKISLSANGLETQGGSVCSLVRLCWTVGCSPPISLRPLPVATVVQVVAPAGAAAAIATGASGVWFYQQVNLDPGGKCISRLMVLSGFLIPQN